MDTYRWQRVANGLRGQIEAGSLPPGTRLPAEGDLAREWGVSRMTAHRAMSELQAAGLVERRPRVGTVVAERRGLASVAVLMHSAGLFPQANYVQGIIAGLPADCEVRLCDTADSPEREIELLDSLVGKTDGILIYPTASPDTAEALGRAAAAVPLVCVDRAPDEVSLDAVTTDERESSLAGLRLLTSVGHTRIAHLTDDTLHVSSIRGRLDAYLQALSKGGTLGTQWLRTFAATDHWSFDQLVETIHAALRSMMHSPEPPTAVFCVNDPYLAATLVSAERLGLRVSPDPAPGALALLAVNDSPALPVAGLERVHRIVPRTVEMGRLAAERLALRAADPTLAPETIRLRSDLVPAVSHLAPALA